MMPVTQMPTFDTIQPPSVYFGSDAGDPGGGSAGRKRPGAKTSKKGAKKGGASKSGKKPGAKRK